MNDFTTSFVVDQSPEEVFEAKVPKSASGWARRSALTSKRMATRRRSTSLTWGCCPNSSALMCVQRLGLAHAEQLAEFDR